MRGKEGRNNHANQMNPNNDAYWQLDFAHF